MDEVVRKHPHAKCEECPLREVGKYVNASGPASASIAFVGEAPTRKDALAGRPFTGPGGQLLTTVATHHGIDGGDIVLDNACACRPPDNGPPPKSAILACRPRLVHELSSRGVRDVVALGNSASLSLLGVDGVTKLRVGPGRPGKYIDDVRVISTYHPAAALRQADIFPHIVTDVGKLVNRPPKWEPPQFVVADDEGSALDLMAQVDAKEPPLLVIDIEADIEKIAGEFCHPNRYGMLCVGIGYAKAKVLVIGEEAMKSVRVREVLGELLRKYPLVGQNLKFDLAGMQPVVGALRGWFDVMLASYTFDERPGIHSLDFQGIEYLGTPNWKAQISRYVGPHDTYGVIPRDVLYKYNAYDVAVTWDLCEMYLARYELPEYADLRKVHDFLMAASNELMFVQLNGIAINKKYLDKLTDEYLDVLEQIEDKLNDVIGRSINPRSWMQVRDYLQEAGVNIPLKRNQKGEMKPSTDSDNLKDILEKQCEPESEVANFIRVLLKHRKESKLYGTYVKGARTRLYGGRLHPTFLLHGTTTGRLACRNPNLQNVPRESSIRRLYVPAKADNVFIQTDYSQAELRVLSFLARDVYFRDIFNGGERDLFDELTPILYPELGSKDRVPPAQWKETRIRVKAYVYGLAYGRTEFSIASEYGIPVVEAKRGMSAFFDVIPEIVEFREKTKQDVLAGNDLVTPFSRRRRFMLITNDNVDSVMNEALAFLPQSTASDMCLRAFTRLRPKLKGIGHVRNLIHDAILAECHREDAEEVKAMMEQEMLDSAHEVVEGYVKFAVESNIGPSWGDV